MKVLIPKIAILFTCISMLFSCDSKEVAVVKPQPNLALVKELENVPQAVIRVALTKLSNEEKTALWQNHFDKILSNDNLSDELRVHTLKLKALVTPEYFSRVGTPAFESFMKEFTKEWYTKPIASGTFNVQDLNYIGTVYGLGSDAIQSSLNDSPSSNLLAPEPVSCGCSYDIYCSNGGTNSTSCASASCLREGGCGITGTSNCSGNCK